MYDMFDPIAAELDKMRQEGYLKESEHDCKGCQNRVGIPCLIAKSCKKYKTDAKNGKSYK